MSLKLMLAGCRSSRVAERIREMEFREKQGGRRWRLIFLFLS